MNIFFLINFIRPKRFRLIFYRLCGLVLEVFMRNKIFMLLSGSHEMLNRIQLLVQPFSRFKIVDWVSGSVFC